MKKYTSQKNLLSLTAVVILFGIIIQVSTTQAQGISTYTVKRGDNLWKIANRELGTPWCWPLIASTIENKIDYQGFLAQGKTITLPSKEACEDIVSPLRTNAKKISGTTLAIFKGQPWESQGLLISSYIRGTYPSDAEKVSQEKTQLYYDDNSHRVQDGKFWYVIFDGKRGRAWDYVDKIIQSKETNSIFYRARDVQGNWYIVKNEEPKKLSFEPQLLYLNPLLDEVFTVNRPLKHSSTPHKKEVEGLSTKIFTHVGEWSIPGSAYPIAIDNEGNILFSASTRVEVRTTDNQGKIFEVCSSSTCSLDYSFWLNDTKIADAKRRMVPLYSKLDAPIKLPFYYEGTQKGFKYYGLFYLPAFDEKDRLVFYLVNDNTLIKQVFDVNEYRKTK